MKKIASLLILFSLFINPQNTNALTDGGGSVALLTKEIGADPIATAITTRILTKLVNDTINWSLGGFKQPLGFVDNWDQFLEDTKYDLLSNSFNLASSVIGSINDRENNQSNAQKQERYYACISRAHKDNDELEVDGTFYTQEDIDKELQDSLAECEKILTGNSSSSIAEENYKNRGKDSDARQVANVIINDAAKTLNDGALKALISEKTETLSTLLGGESQAENFKSDISAGGILGYIALTDPHNTTIRKAQLIKAELAKERTIAVQNKIDDQQTEQKFLNKTRCVRYDRKADGSKGDCLDEQVTTPGGQISALANQSIKREGEQLLLAREVSDVLAQGLGRLTDALIQKGVSKLSSQISKQADNASSKLAGAITGNYQNEYDVLGINSTSRTSEGSGTISDSGSSSSSGSNNYTDSAYGDDGSAPYIGGPEDISGSNWNEGPELIINLQENLEKALIKERERKILLVEVQSALKKNIPNLISLDRCIPGPDYGWQERYQGGQNSDNETRRNQAIIGYAEMEQIIADPQANIPGALTALSLVKQSLTNTGSYTQTEDQFAQSSNNIVILENIINDIQKSIKSDQRLISEVTLYNGSNSEGNTKKVSDIILLESQWEKLSQNEKIQWAEQPLLGSYYLFRDNGTTESSDDETAQDALANNEEKLMNAVITMSWDIWRSVLNNNDEDLSFKSDLRYSYYLIRTKLATNAELLELDLARKQHVKRSNELRDVLSDCTELKAYSTGLSVELLGYLHSGGKGGSYNSPAGISGVPHAAIGIEVLGHFLSGGKGSLGSSSFLSKIFSFDGYDIYGLKEPKPKTDASIKSFLEEEEANGEGGVLKTDVFTNPSAVNNSILGFSTEAAKDTYFDSIYPDTGIVHHQVNSNAKSMRQIYRLDTVQTSFGRANKLTGTLFCRIKSKSDLDEANTNKDASDCFHDAYKISNLEYEVLFAEI